MKTPQTVYLVATFKFNRIEIPFEKQEKVFVFETHEAMDKAWSKARRARRILDRPTSGTYQLRLTGHGQLVCKSDPLAKAAHYDQINRDLKI